MEFIKKNIGYLIVLSGLGFFVYAFNLHGPLFWDDADWILNNPTVQALTWTNIKFLFSHDALASIGSSSNYYRPFLFLTFLFNYIISGTAPVLYHLINNTIHIANALMLFYLVVRWLKNQRVAFLAALLFLIHPLQTEALTYVVGRGDPLSVAFMLAGIILFLHHRRWLAGLAMILAILTKETAVLFPLYLALGLIAFEYRLRWWRAIRQAFFDVWPFLGVAIIYGLLRLTALNFQNTLNFYTQQNFYSTHLSVRLYTFFHVLLVYGRLIIWPVGLHMDRDIAISFSLATGWAWLGFLGLVILVGWLIFLYKYEGMSQKFSVWLFGTGIFFINLGPTSGIIPANARIYEHWLYVPLMGAGLIVGFYLDRLLSIIKKRKPVLFPFVIIILVGYFGFLGIQTIRRNLLWGDTEAFYKNILYYEPTDVRVLNNLGNWYSDRGNTTDAAPLYQRAIDADPTQPAPYYNLGNIARDNSGLIQAEMLYKKAISVDPTFHYAYGNLAQLYLNNKRYSDALDMLEKLQQIYPNDQTFQNIDTLKNLINK